MTPVIWLHKDGVCSRCRMDEWIIEDWLDGAQKRPAAGLVPVHTEATSLEGVAYQQAVIVLPAGNHIDDVAWVNEQIRWVQKLTLVLTSDEGAHFPVDKLRHPNMHLWVQTPRPEVAYPDGTRFFGVGSGRAWRHVHPLPVVERLFFAGQNTHARRDAAIAYASRVPGDVKVIATPAFMQGMERTAYLAHMNQTLWAPCPSGIETQDSFRFYEALECGALPIADGLRIDARGLSYWDLVAPGLPLKPVGDWAELPQLVRDHPAPEAAAVATHAWWHLRRREMVRLLAQDVGVEEGREDLTVVIPTSPIPSHPSTKILDETIRSIRERTNAEILVMCDGVRSEQRSRQPDYNEYLRQILQKAEADWWNVTPIVYGVHLHQARMLQLTLPRVHTEYVMFVEHDTPLVGEIQFETVLKTMADNRLNVMRFYHESVIQEDHEWLMTGPVRPGGWRPTMQWSQRPHVARTDFYEKVMTENFATDANVMIEDVMFGIVEHSHRVIGDHVWNLWRLGIWHPEGNIQRSIHLDGREGESKYEERFRYRYPGGTEGRPPGSPHPQVGM